MQSNAGMANRQGGRRLALRASHRPPVNTLVWQRDSFIHSVVSAGGRLTINASPPGWTLRSVAERGQFGCDQG